MPPYGLTTEIHLNPHKSTNDSSSAAIRRSNDDLSVGGGSIGSTERPYKGFKGLRQCLQEFRNEYDKDKL